MTSSPPKASAWTDLLARPDPPYRRVLEATYGSREDVIRERVDLLRRITARYLDRFGDGPVRLFRAPSRINLRGMHVDTHGGFLNLMTHQREIVVAAGASARSEIAVANIDPEFAEVEFASSDIAAFPGIDAPWTTLVMRPEIRHAVEAKRGDWGHYVRGSWLVVRHRFPRTPLAGVNAVVGSDVPQGASLSSSAALCVSLAHAALTCNGLELDDTGLIQAARDAEWYTGSRCGLSDQAAIVLGGRNEIVHLAIRPRSLEIGSARRIAFPDNLRVLVVNSFTRRSLSGEALVAYTRNRFAYSLALEILRQEMRRQGFPETLVVRIEYLSDISPETFGGVAALYRLLQAVPENLGIDSAHNRYELPSFEADYAQYFGTVPEALRPRSIDFRGPLLFGIAESARARRFAEAIASGRYEEAGALMTTGHGGDRCIRADGTHYGTDVSDAALARLARIGAPIESCPGAYGASTPALDFIVDAALRAGALGASLTGAGLAGSVLALCRAEHAETVAASIGDGLASPEYAHAAGLPETLSGSQLRQSVLVNAAVASAGELVAPGD